MRRWLWPLLLTGCAEPDLFLVDGFIQADWPPNIDVLWVLDHSESMRDEGTALATEFASWTQRLEAGRAAIGSDGLSDAVDNYLLDIQDRAAFADIQFGVVDADARNGKGLLLGETPLVNLDDPDFATTLQRNVLCHATCIGDVADDPSVTCGTPFNGTLSTQYLDCLCGEDQWGTCSGDVEMPIEAAVLAWCRAFEQPPSTCTNESGLFTASMAGTQVGLSRPDSVFLPILVSDEGDASPRPGVLNPVADVYLDPFREVSQPSNWVTIGPQLDEQDRPLCGGTTTAWGTLRYGFMADNTGGQVFPIHEADCSPAPFSGTLDRLVDLLGGYGALYPLRTAANVDTLVVRVDGTQIPPSGGRSPDAYGLPDWSDGWTYQVDPPAVRLHGGAIPAPNAQVEIVYLPEGYPQP